MPGFEDAGLNPMQSTRAVSLITPQSSGVSNSPALVIHKLLAHPENPDIAWAATNAGVYETMDGQHWALVSVPLDIIDLAVSPANPDYVIGVSRESQGYIYLPFRGCPSNTQCKWYYDSKQPGQILFNVIRLDPLVSYRLLTDGEVYKSGNKVIGIYQSIDRFTWQLLGDLGVDGKISALEIAPQNPRFMLALVENFPGNTHWLFCSQDGGATWIDWSAGLPELFGRGYSLVIDDLGTAYAGTYNGVYRRRPNDGAWEPYWLDKLLMRSIYSLAYVPGSAPKLLASTEYVLWRLDLPPIRRIWLPLVRGSAP